MGKVCSSKRDAAFISSPPTEFVMYDHSKTPSFDRGNRQPRRRDLFFIGLYRTRGLFTFDCSVFARFPVATEP